MRYKSIKPSPSVRQYSDELVATTRKWKQEIAQREIAEAALKQCERHHLQLITKSLRMQEQLRKLSHKILSAQEEERKQISRELHDEIAQSLAGINVYLEALRQEAMANTKGIGRNIVRTQKLVEKSLTKVHRFARDLRPKVLDDLGLIPALHAFAKDLAKGTQLRIHIKASSEVETLSIFKRTVLYRVAQESLTNISRHAKTNDVKLNLEKKPDGFQLEICDNGKAFSVEKVLHGKRSQRLGLIGMRERVEMVGGSFSIESTPGKGTTVRAHMPLDPGVTNKSPKESTPIHSES